jgi:hypothetical protein
MMKYAEVCELNRQQAEALLRIDAQPLDTTLNQYHQLRNRANEKLQEVIALSLEARRVLDADSTPT